ncbi:MAG: sulfurtransferase TusA family protein [Actinobacteria bacterium]|nr:MAG: sulfurtransferase TusA family protein [Actinomycetota bacterium]
MATKQVDARGLRCPQPVLKITTAMPDMQPGDIMEVSADCATFDEDVRKWCDRMGKTLLAITKEGEMSVAQIRF